MRHLDQGPLGELLVDLGFVHDVLGSAGVLQRAQRLLQAAEVGVRYLRTGSGSRSEPGLTSRLLEDGDTVAMMEVLVRPPSESCKILVSLDSLWKNRAHS